jgi:hypothetical protein
MRGARLNDCLDDVQRIAYKPTEGPCHASSDQVKRNLPALFRLLALTAVYSIEELLEDFIAVEIDSPTRNVSHAGGPHASIQASVALSLYDSRNHLPVARTRVLGNLSLALEDFRRSVDRYSYRPREASSHQTLSGVVKLKVMLSV